MKRYILIFGDIVVLAIITLIGFAAHREADPSYLPRMGATFIPLTLAWFLLSFQLGLFQPEIASSPKALWKPAYTMLFAAPLAVTLRGLLLNTPLLPIFALVLTFSSAVGMTLWRGIYLLLTRKTP
ncbi:MAG TPA: DUF3054 family protein [Anaerolineales bacterium]|nr:DUF3054 family protein [Anaerolineales bacterium]